MGNYLPGSKPHTRLVGLFIVLVLFVAALGHAHLRRAPTPPAHAHAPTSEPAHLADAVTIEYVGGIGGTVEAVAIDGDYAYIGYGGWFIVLDMSTPSQPTRVGRLHLPAIPRDIHIVDTTAYVASGDGLLYIIDISTPASPTLLGSYDTPGYAGGVQVVGTTAYVADGEYGGLQILNVANPALPTLLGSYDTPSKAWDVQVVGTTAYVADDNSGLQILDVANPASPTLLGSYDTPSSALDVQVVGTTAYVADGNSGLQILDVANPASPTLLGSYDTPGRAEDVQVVGTTAYVADGVSVQILDIANPASPTLLGSYDTPGFAVDVQVVGTTAYVADWISGLQILDIANPAEPTLLGSYYDKTGFAYDVQVVGTTAYVADYWSGLQILDVANPASPTLLGSYDTPWAAYDVHVVDTTAYVADDDSGLQILNVANPASPTLLGSYDTPGFARGVQVVGTTAYVADGGSGLQILDVANPASPTLLGSYDTPGYVLDVQVVGTTAYVTDYWSGLQILDVATPAEPTPLGGYATLGYAFDVQVVGTTAYVAYGEDGGLQILDVANPASPTPLGSYNTPGSAYAVQVVGTTAYVTDYWSGLQILDVANPASPTLLGSYDTPGYALGVQVIEDLVYIADREGGLQIVRVLGGAATTPTPTPVAATTPTPTPVAATTPTPTPVAVTTPTPTPTDAPTPTPTAIPSPTPTPTPTAIPNPTPTPQPDSYEPNDTCASASAIASDGTIQQHTFATSTDVDWVQFDATQGETYLIEAYATTNSQADIILEVYTSCDKTYGSYDPTFSPGVKMQIVAPATGPIFLRMVNQNPDVYGEQVSYNVSVRHLTSGDTGALILVAGRYKPNDGLQPNIHAVTQNVYKVFKNDGRYTDEHINYLATDLSLTGVDTLATKDNLQAAITTWAAERVDQDHPLTLYLMDHGSKDDGFYLDEPRGERVSPDELAQWLDTLPDEVQVNVIIEACYSGVFVEALTKPGRVVITSTSANNIAHASADGATFSDHFLTQLKQGSSLYTAFQAGRDAVVAAQYGLPQFPWIEDNGNGTTNEADDGLIAQQRGFSMGTLSGDVEPEGFAWHPYIVEVEKPASVVDERGTIRANVRDDKAIQQVWAVVYEPSYTPPTTQNEMVNETDALPSLVLSKQTTDQYGAWYGAEYTQFDEPGTYRVVVYAKDDEGLDAQPVAVEVTVGGDVRRVFLPLVRR